jgi:hypothetical protein
MQTSRASTFFAFSLPGILPLTLVVFPITGSFPSSALADEHLFGWVLGAETLPSKRAEAYEFLTLRTGKTEGSGRFCDAPGGRLPGHDEVDGLKQTEGYIAPQFILQKNYFDDTLIFDVNGGAEFAWGKRPAEQYPRELSLTGGAGVSYRFAPNCV